MSLAFASGGELNITSDTANTDGGSLVKSRVIGQSSQRLQILARGHASKAAHNPANEGSDYPNAKAQADYPRHNLIPHLLEGSPAPIGRAELLP